MPYRQNASAPPEPLAAELRKIVSSCSLRDDINRYISEALADQLRERAREGRYETQVELPPEFRHRVALGLFVGMASKQGLSVYARTDYNSKDLDGNTITVSWSLNPNE